MEAANPRAFKRRKSPAASASTAKKGGQVVDAIRNSRRTAFYPGIVDVCLEGQGDFRPVAAVVAQPLEPAYPRFRRRKPMVSCQAAAAAWAW